MTADSDAEQDLTRKERREQARADRKAAEQAHVASTQRRTRLTQLGAVAAVVIVAVVIIAIATGSSSGHHQNKEGSKANQSQIAEVSKLLNGIEQKGNVLGKENAPVTLEYFGDLECPVCRSFTLGALPLIIEQWVREGKLRIEYRSLETATHEPEIFRTQQVAALAAGKQNKMWNYVELFYHEQGEEGTEYVTEEYLHKLAVGVPGLNITKWKADRNDTALANQIAEDQQAATAQGFGGTPSFLLGHTGGAMSKFEAESLTDPTSFNNAIQKLI
jgi:protein-disulfide isomerase